MTTRPTARERIWLLYEDDENGRWVRGVFRDEDAAKAEQDRLHQAEIEAANTAARKRYDDDVACRGMWWFKPPEPAHGEGLTAVMDRDQPHMTDSDGCRRPAEFRPDPEPPEPFVPVTEVWSYYTVESLELR